MLDEPRTDCPFMYTAPWTTKCFGTFRAVSVLSSVDLPAPLERFCDSFCILYLAPMIAMSCPGFATPVQSARIFLSPIRTVRCVQARVIGS